MESFHWDKHFETGLDEVDKQHHHLVDIINSFGEQLARNEIDFTAIEAIFTELAEYAQYHFQEEEHLMAQMGLDQRHIETHIKVHQDFIQEVLSIHASVSPDDPGSVRHLLEFLTHWLAYHILGMDQNMARQIKALVSGATPQGAYETEDDANNGATEALLVALSGLFQEVSLQNKKLLQLNQSLEKKIQERTQALSEANLHLDEIARTDLLTGLPNRRHAMQQLNSQWNASVETSQPLVCMMIDADHFKEVNDSYGHDAGDAVLCELSQTLHDSLRSDDLVCRLGGDEFFILCPNTDHEGGMNIAELVRKKVSEMRVPTADGFWVGSISIGVAARSPEMKEYESLIKRADDGVYAAKRDGKNCVRSL
ncbi:MAG: GGDEF domain-containing protein [Helicobacteraceae bacterium]|jgi:diguanylate cyclase (GGDEF)-like protein/hemerythrin-like metal-binding protein|nr:GGDEF domain-containing protein [Helicobacteraceae bacterium]